MQWTDSISDNGLVGLDPLVPALPVPLPVPVAAASPVPVQPAQFGQPQPVAHQTPVSAIQTDVPTPSSPLKWILPIAAVAVVGGGLFFLLGRGDDKSEAFGAVQATLSKSTPIYSTTYTLKRGESVRFRVEPIDSDLDVKAVWLADDDTTSSFADALYEVISDEAFVSDVDEVSDLLFTDGRSLTSDRDTPIRTMTALQVSDSGYEGEIEADLFLALTDGTFTFAVLGVDNGRGDIRAIVQKFDDNVEIGSFSDLDSFFSDEPFFTDDSFFSDSDEFQLDS